MNLLLQQHGPLHATGILHVDVCQHVSLVCAEFLPHWLCHSLPSILPYSRLAEAKTSINLCALRF